MKKLIFILICSVGFFSCKKEEKLIKYRFCKTCVDRSYYSSDKQKTEIVTSTKYTKYCFDDPSKANKKTTTSVMFDMQDPLHPMYRSETDCSDAIDSTNIVIDTTNNNIGG
jgi:hypothetical protein